MPTAPNEDGMTPVGERPATHPRRPGRPGRPKALYRKIAVAVRRLLIARGTPMVAAQIWMVLSPELRATVEQNHLPRCLRRSKRAGLVQTSGKWWVRKSWLATTDIPWKRPLSDSTLAEQRCLLREACEQAIDILRKSTTPMSASEIREQLSDVNVDARMFRRALWNRASANKQIRRVGSSTYQWVCTDREKRGAKWPPTARDG
jgi:hypothetical protein